MGGSGEAARLLWKRARGMLEGARWRLGRGEYDLACFEAEQAAQLALKALLAELTGRAPRMHGLTELLGVLYRFLRDAGLGDAAAEVASFAASRRPSLWALEEAYYTGRYGAVEYTRSDAEECLRVAEEVVRWRGW